MRHNPKPQELYRHFKGNLYQIICLAKHSETREMMVVYQAMYDTFEIYVRPLAMFMEEVDHVKYPQVQQKYRFELLQDMKNDNEYADMAEGRKAETGRQTAEVQGKTELVKEKNRVQETKIVQETGGDIAEQIEIDPLVMEFLDADSYEQKLNILAALHNRITDEMINTMAIATDIEIKDGNVEERYEELKNCLITFEKYECNRLR